MKRYKIYFIDEDPAARRANARSLSALLGDPGLKIIPQEPLARFSDYNALLADPATAACRSSMSYTPFCLLVRREKYEADETSGSYYEYSHYRQAIAEDCNWRCVYCDCHEDLIGGKEIMELDHFRPWNKTFGVLKEKKFEHLKNEPTNLVHACRVCNGFKWAHWPTEDPDKAYDTEKGWIDPFKELRSDFVELTYDGTLSPKKAPAKYQIKKLRLNRPLLKRIRERIFLTEKLERLRDAVKPKWEALANQPQGTAHAQTAREALDMLELVEQILKR